MSCTHPNMPKPISPHVGAAHAPSGSDFRPSAPRAGTGQASGSGTAAWRGGAGTTARERRNRRTYAANRRDWQLRMESERQAKTARQTPTGVRRISREVERATGVEPASKAWEAFILPMNYARKPARLWQAQDHSLPRPPRNGKQATRMTATHDDAGTAARTPRATAQARYHRHGMASHRRHTLIPPTHCARRKAWTPIAMTPKPPPPPRHIVRVERRGWSLA